MSIFEIIGSVVLIVTCIFITLLVLKQESKGRGLSTAIMGGPMNDDTRGRMTQSAKLAVATRYAGIVLFVSICLMSSGTTLNRSPTMP